MYGFETSERLSIQNANRRLVQKLKDDFGMLYRELGSTKNNTKRSGLLRHKIIQTAINLVCFRNKRDLGVIYEEYFNPFPVTGLAFIFTAIECCIDEWASGTRTEVSFTEEGYKEVYDRHVANLRKFDEHTRAHEILPTLLQRLHDSGW
ncbi:hypothetical protein BJ138DRAFT_1019520 [Hygrophoropsis aurantiaca]|uniref:Uncharacterized protein n=1 Tax=Hygrophoropsis aurantiaca TaxID=72124 RepID=A0ACB7ZSU9_9AGAM|nr:hypothetical protein BJ138DRAFT_1019520 [Hygrophoropsis aurantiaca]